MITKFTRIDGDSTYRAKIAFGGIGEMGRKSVVSYRLYSDDLEFGPDFVTFTYPEKENGDHYDELLRKNLQGYDWVFVAVDPEEDRAIEDARECADLLRADNANARMELFCVILKQHAETPVAEVLLQHYDKVFFVQHPAQMSIPVEMVRAVGCGRNLVGVDYADLFSTISPHKRIYVLQEKCANTQLLRETARKMAGELTLRRNQNDNVMIAVQAGVDCCIDDYESVWYDLMQYVGENANVFLYAYYNAEEYDMSVAITVMLCVE